MNNKTIGIMEILWLIIAIIAFLVGIYQSILVGFKNSYMFFIFLIIALLMFFFRKALRNNSKGY